MIKVRKANDRGRTRIGWLDGRHSFSFGRYVDREHMGFRTLRVINDDVIAPEGGFPEHPHENMEIITYVVRGRLAHRDSTGTVAELGAGGVQRMSAGRGIRHSEFNPSSDEPLRLLQIWIMPASEGIDPGYEDIKPEPGNPFRLIASRDGREGSTTIHQDGAVFGGVLGARTETIAIGADRHAWVQAVRGAVSVNGIGLDEGDGAAISGEASLELVGKDDGSELLVFDLA